MMVVMNRWRWFQAADSTTSVITAVRPSAAAIDEATATCSKLANTIVAIVAENAAVTMAHNLLRGVHKTVVGEGTFGFDFFSGFFFLFIGLVLRIMNWKAAMCKFAGLTITVSSTQAHRFAACAAVLSTTCTAFGSDGFAIIHNNMSR
jgi:hypothetical protein